jgi:phospholipid transport system substrate-binding protein
MFRKPRVSQPARLLLLLVGLFFVTAPALAQGTGGPATRYLRSRNEEANRVLQRPATTDAARAARSHDVTQILSDLLDFQELSRRSLGTHWDGLTEAQRREFVGLLQQLVERNYQANLERVLDFDISYTAEQQTADGTTVTTSARSRTERRQPPVEIVYTLHLQGTTWRVFDVVTDGVSLVRNYRNQFNRVIADHDFPELLRRMRERLTGEGGAAAPAPAPTPAPATPAVAPRTTARRRAPR